MILAPPPALTAPAPTSPAVTAPVEVAIVNVRNASGRVHIDICTAETYLKVCPYSGTAPARPGITVVTIRGVPPGRYAVEAFHDENGNGEIDRGLFGIPKEGVGFSNDAKIRMAPPKFAEAAIDHGRTPQHISFSLRYFQR